MKIVKNYNNDFILIKWYSLVRILFRILSKIIFSEIILYKYSETNVWNKVVANAVISVQITDVV